MSTRNGTVHMCEWKVRRRLSPFEYSMQSEKSNFDQYDDHLKFPTEVVVTLPSWLSPRTRDAGYDGSTMFSPCCTRLRGFSLRMCTADRSLSVARIIEGPPLPSFRWSPSYIMELTPPRVGRGDERQPFALSLGLQPSPALAVVPPPFLSSPLTSFHRLVHF